MAAHQNHRLMDGELLWYIMRKTEIGRNSTVERKGLNQFWVYSQKRTGSVSISPLNINNSFPRIEEVLASKNL